MKKNTHLKVVMTITKLLCLVSFMFTMLYACALDSPGFKAFWLMSGFGVLTIILYLVYKMTQDLYAERMKLLK